MAVFAKQQGFSLLELLITLTIFLVLAAVAVPDLSQSIGKHRTERKTRDLLTLLHLARNKAVTEGSLTTVCPLDEGNKCVKDWNRFPISLFLDPQNKRELSDQTFLIRTLPATDQVNLTVAPVHKSYFQFDSLGASHGSMGNLSVCNTGDVLYSAKQIVINLSGRPRMSVDKNGDGISERSNGDAVRC